MNRFITFIILIACLTTGALAQTAKINITVAHFNGTISVIDPSARFIPGRGHGLSIPLALNAQHTATYTTGALNQPEYIKVFMYGSAFYIGNVWLSPGDDLAFKIDLAKKPYVFTVSGKGGNNNQPEIFSLTDFDTQLYRNYSAPNLLIAALNKQSRLNKTILAGYIKRYHPTPDFIKVSQQNLAYFAPSIFYQFHHDYYHDETNPVLSKWQPVEDSLLATVKLNNDGALAACNYKLLIDQFMLREKERLMVEQMEHPEQFFKTWYHTTAYKGRPIYESERQNLFVERILNKHFSGKTAEYLYSEMFKMNLLTHNPTHMGEMYSRFKQKYPNSPYIAWYDAPVNDVVSKQAQGLNKNMIFPPDNGSKINTWKEVLAMVKGKTVLVDMWGTWCSPCREELAENSTPLREHFKGKPVVFLYIDSFDQKNEKLWKNLIAYLHLEGMHILANDMLNKDIVTKLKFSGYPSYFLIKKDGTYGKTKTQYRVNREAMIKEIEAAM